MFYNRCAISMAEALINLSDSKITKSRDMSRHWFGIGLLHNALGYVVWTLDSINHE